MSNWKVTFEGIDDLKATLDSIQENVKSRGQERALMAGGFIVEGAAKLNLDKQGLRDTGLLINSITVHEYVDKGVDSYVLVGSRGVVYARIHEFGGTIVAKRVRNLAIPLTDAAKKAGSPRAMRGLSWRPGLLVDRQGKPQFVLKPTVTIPARPYMRPAVDENQAEIMHVIKYQLKKATWVGG